MINEWDMSSCADGLLHWFKIIETTPEGVVEICKLCGKTIFFPADCDNLTYLSYHFREALPADHPLFPLIYPNGIKYKPKKTS